jgi:hypothetical protein
VLRYTWRVGAQLPVDDAAARIPLRSFVGVVLVCQLFGGVTAAVILMRGSPASAATVGQAVPTSFGVISVDQAESIAASNPDRDTLIPGLEEVQVAVTMTNLLGRPIHYARDQVSLAVSAGATEVPVSSASIYAGWLRPGAAFRIVYRFDVPSAAGRLRMRFRDAGRAAPVWIDLGSRPYPVGLSSAYNVHLHSYTPHLHGAVK